MLANHHATTWFGGRQSPARKALRRSAAVLWSMLIVTTAGCGGCDPEPDAQQAQKEEDEKNKKEEQAKKEKDRLEFSVPRALVSPEPTASADSESPGASRPTRLVVKPGHWTATVQTMQANYDDLVGQMTTSLLDKNLQPARLQPTRFTFDSTRPLALAKGRPKRIVGELFVPEQTTGVQLQTILRDRDTGQNTYQLRLPLTTMPSFQYHLVVLAKEASRYGFLKVTDAIKPPWEGEFEAAPDVHYRVVLADASKPIPLPDNLFTWTSIAYLVWDEVDATRLSAAQQSALIDWLHWGGRLLLSGPDSLDTLRGSFLDPYLPVDKGVARKFSAADLSAWSEFWSSRTKGKPVSPLKPIQSWSGVKLQPRAQARELAGGSQLFYECDVGRGSIVVSAIQLAERDLVNWPGYDGFINSALLLRPSRRFFASASYGGLSVDWANLPGRRLDSHLATSLRLFARDATTEANMTPNNEAAEDDFNANGFLGGEFRLTHRIDRPGGVGSWNAFSPGATSARESLTSAAAVQIPGAGFVVACLAVYLVVLVPLNWTLFKSLGHAEWAWIAAPVIASLGTLIIVRMAQLDIGFVRSQTEISLLELQGSHPRGLLSRYTALYSSLSTTYDIHYENPEAFAAPFAASASTNVKPGDAIWNVQLDRHGKTHLSGLAVSSASTRMVQSEEMFECAGALRLGMSSRNHEQLENHLGYNLRDVVVLRRSFDPNGRARLMGSWIGRLKTGTSAVLGLTPVSFPEGQLPYAAKRDEAAATAYSPTLNVNALLRLAFQFPGANDPSNARRDETRVVGRVDDVLPGCLVAPASSQIQGATVVLAHLKYGARPLPERDANSPHDILNKKL